MIKKNPRFPVSGSGSFRFSLHKLAIAHVVLVVKTCARGHYRARTDDIRRRKRHEITFRFLILFFHFYISL